MMRILAELEHDSDSESTSYIDSINTYEPFITEFLIYNILMTNFIFRWPSWLCYRYNNMMELIKSVLK